MSDIERTKGLLATDDPMVWAEEFCRIFDGKEITSETDPSVYKGDAIDVGTMVGWFANAMQTAIDITKARRERIAAAMETIPESERAAFVAGFDEGREGTPT